MDALPAELLERVLALLAPAELVRCRAVSRRWRVHVSSLQEVDAAWVYRCGAPDLLADWKRHPRLYDESPNAETCARFLDSFYARVVFPCSCGTVIDHARLCTQMTVAPDLSDQNAGWYPREHPTRFPPARWEILAAERARAWAVTEAARGLVQHSDVLSLSYHAHGGGFFGEWLPAWRYLPADVVRPMTAAGMARLVYGIFSGQQQRGDTSGLQQWTVTGGGRTLLARAEAETSVQARRYRPDSSGACFAAFVKTHAAGELLRRTATLYVCNMALEYLPHGDDDEMAYFCRSCCADNESVARAWASAVAAYQAAADSGDDGGDDGDGAGERADDAGADREGASWADLKLLGPRPRPHARDDYDDWTSNYEMFERLCEDVRDHHPLYDQAQRRIEVIDPSGWGLWRLQARQSAASWRACRALGWTEWLRINPGSSGADMLFHAIKWRAMTDEAVQMSLDDQVAAVDRIRHTIAVHCRHPVIVRVSEYHSWVGGLSPAGHLVGAVTREHATD